VHAVARACGAVAAEKRCSVGRDDNDFSAILKAMMAQS